MNSKETKPGAPPQRSTATDPFDRTGRGPVVRMERTGFRAGRWWAGILVVLVLAGASTLLVVEWQRRDRETRLSEARRTGNPFVGMTADEVKGAIGDPSIVTVEAAGQHVNESWEYHHKFDDRGRSLLLTVSIEDGVVIGWKLSH